MDEPARPSGFGRVVAWWRRQSQRLKDHFAEYGVIALVTWFLILGVSWAGFAVAISQGCAVDGGGADASTIGTAYVATQVIKPLRIVLTIALTPFVAGLWFRIRPPKPPVSVLADEPDAAEKPRSEPPPSP
jgi:hypothetical protein